MKFTKSVSAMFSVAMLAGVVFLGYQSLEVIQKAQRNEVAEVQHLITKEIDTKAEQAIFMATAIAGSQPVQQAVKDHDRDFLATHFTSVWQTMNEQFGVKQFQFHTPESASLFRLHMPSSFGDPLSGFRRTVVEANQLLEPTKGIESGVAGIGIRGVVPIFSNNQHVGSVEIGFAFDEAFIKSLEVKFDAIISVYLTSSSGQEEVFYPGKNNTNNSVTISAPLKDYSKTEIGFIDVTCCETSFNTSRNIVITSTTLVILLIGVMWFITKKIEHRLERKRSLLKQKNEELEQKVRKEKVMFDYLTKQSRIASLGKLVSSVAHEINTPLGVIVTSTTSLSDKVNEILEQFNEGELKKSDLQNYWQYSGEALTLVESSAKRLSELINNFKQLSVSNNSREVSDFSLYQVALSVVNSYATDIRETKVSVDIEIPESLTFRGVYLDFIQIFQALLSNAFSHANKTGTLQNIRICGNASDGILNIAVIDDGSGIPNEQLNDIFEPFFSTSKSDLSTGLGLSILHNILTLKLSGSVRAESPVTLGGGTVIQIQIPVDITTVEDKTILIPHQVHEYNAETEFSV